MTLTYPTPFGSFAGQLRQFFSPLTAILASFFGVDDTGEEVVEDATPRPSMEEVQRRQAGMYDRLFGDGGEEDPPEPKGDKKPEKKPDKKPDKKQEETDDESDDEADSDEDDTDTDESGDNDDTDYESDDEEGAGDDQEGEGEKKAEEEGDRETKAQRDAKENGRKVKQLDAALTEAKLELTTTKEALVEAQQRIADFSKVTIDPRSDPSFVELNDAMWADVDAAVADDLSPNARGLANEGTFNAYMKTYLKSTRLTSDERAAAIQDLKATIVKDLGGFADPYADLIEDEKVVADTLAKEVLAVIRRNAPRAEGMIKLEATLREKAKSGRLSLGAQEYERQKAKIVPLVANLGKLDDKMVEESPYAPEAVVTQLVRDNPKLAKKLDNAREDVMELILGQKPLTQTEYDSLEEQGVDIKTFLKERERRFDDKKQKLIPLLVRGLFAASFTKAALENIAKEQREKADEEDEMKALASIERTRKVKVKPEDKKDKKEIPANRRPSAIEKYLD